MSVVDGLAVEAWMERKEMCFTLCDYDLQHEGPHGGLSIEGESSFMLEDAPAPFEYFHR